MSSKLRCHLVAAIAGLSGLIAAGPASARVGALTQLRGKAGCVAQQDAVKKVRKGCRVARFGGHQMWAAQVSPDGRNLYVVSIGGALSVLRISKGRLHQLHGKAGCFSRTGKFGCTVVPQLNHTVDLALSPDGRSVYVTVSDHTGAFGGVVVFGRNRRSGALHKAGCMGENGTGGCAPVRGLLRSVSAVAASPDGRSVYVASNTGDPGAARAGAIAVFARTPTGALGQPAGATGCVNADGRDGCTQAHGLLPTCCGLAVSPDSATVYASSSQFTLTPGTFETQSGSFALAAFSRNPIGILTQLPGSAGCVNRDGSGGCSAAAFAGSLSVNFAGNLSVSRDGRNLYLSHTSIFPEAEAGTCGGGDNFLAMFPRSAADGALGSLAQDVHACGVDPVLAPDGKSLYVNSGNFGSVVSSFARNSRTGKLRSTGCIGHKARGCHAIRHVSAPNAVAITPNGRYVYVLSDDSTFGDTIGVFKRSLS